ncbi:unnamed protein product, partial [Rotaria sp. Silwood2]
FFDEMNLIEPMYIIGASMSATIAAIFATKYPKYISMICLLAPASIKEYESDAIKKLRFGTDSIFLPENCEEFNVMADVLTVKDFNLSQVFIDKYYKSIITSIR